MPTTETFGARLRRLRTQRGLSQTALAGAELSPSYVSLLEADKRVPTRDTVARLAARLDCPVGLLADGVEPELVRDSELELRYAELALRSGEPADAARQLARLLAREPAALPPPLREHAAFLAAQAHERLGDLERAIDGYEALAGAVGPASAAQRWLDCAVALCRCHREAGDLAQAVDVGTRAGRRLAELGLDGTEPAVELAATLLMAHLERGDLATARRLAEETIARAERLGSRRARGAAYWNASLAAAEANRRPEALALAERALAMFAEDDDERNYARLKSTYAALLLRQEPPQTSRALRLLTEAVAELGRTAGEVEVAYGETELARAHLLDGRPEQAAAVAEAALRRLGSGPRLEAPRARIVLAAARLAGGDGRGAAAAYRQAARELDLLGAGRQSAAAWREMAELLAAMGRPSEAVDAYRRASDLAGVAAPTPLPALTARR